MFCALAYILLTHKGYTGHSFKAGCLPEKGIPALIRHLALIGIGPVPPRGGVLS